ncbi:hypothetical protein D3C87_1577890 [compost metagenome]
MALMATYSLLLAIGKTLIPFACNCCTKSTGNFFASGSSSNGEVGSLPFSNFPKISLISGVCTKSLDFLPKSAPSFTHHPINLICSEVIGLRPFGGILFLCPSGRIKRAYNSLFSKSLAIRTFPPSPPFNKCA